QHSRNPLTSGTISSSPVAKRIFFVVKVLLDLVVIEKRSSVFFEAMARSLIKSTLLYWSTCSLALAAISCGGTPSWVLKLWECGVCLLQAQPLSIIKTSFRDRPRARAADSPA